MADHTFEPLIRFEDLFFPLEPAPPNLPVCKRTYEHLLHSLDVLQANVRAPGGGQAGGTPPQGSAPGMAPASPTDQGGTGGGAPSGAALAAGASAGQGGPGNTAPGAMMTPNPQTLPVISADMAKAALKAMQGGQNTATNRNLLRGYAVQNNLTNEFQHTPSEVVKAVKEDFGIAVSRQAVEAYDPTKRAGAGLSAEMRAIFEATRATFLAQTAEIGVSHRVVRLRRLQRMIDKAEGMGNIAMAAKLLEQAAREMGGTFTNSLAVSGDGQGGPIGHSIAIRFVKPGEARRPPEARTA